MAYPRKGTVMSINFDAVLEAALALSESDRLQLVDRLMDTLPPDDVTISMDDPGFHEELNRRLNDGSELIPWSELRAEQ